MKQVIKSMAVAMSVCIATFAAGQSKQLTELDPASFKNAVDQGKARLVDVRTPAEYAAGHLIGSINIDWTADDYETAFAKLDPAMPVLLYCHSGGRSEQALEYLIDKGYKAQHLAGGCAAWKRAGYATVK